MPRYKLTVAYDGTHFHGWQKQADAEGVALRTVQHALELAVRDVVREPVTVVGASRTDSGVHAIGQVAAFTSAVEIPIARLPRAVNSRLPADAQVRRAEIVDESFDPIQDCLTKAYRYRIAHDCGRVRRPLFDRCFTAWTIHRLDPARMNEAARHFIGTHDFASFARVGHGRESTVRTVHDCRVEVDSRTRCRLEIVGNGFLYHMVRIIVGTLLEVGRGKLAPDDVARILAARERAAAGPTMPASGLCLMWIRYP
jgi:tRNA pseudouridine38-40 synthase